MLLNAEPVRVLGDADNPRLRFSEERPDRPDPRRLLFVDDKPAFELSFWCGTCQILFQRQEGSTETFSAEGDDPVEAFGALLPRGDYRPLRLEIQPRRQRATETAARMVVGSVRQRRMWAARSARAMTLPPGMFLLTAVR